MGGSRPTGDGGQLISCDRGDFYHCQAEGTSEQQTLLLLLILTVVVLVFFPS